MNILFLIVIKKYNSVKDSSFRLVRILLNKQTVIETTESEVEHYEFRDYECQTFLTGNKNATAYVYSAGNFQVS
uniref:Uncharacterized protein n=1 Tax=Schistosoma mansoni TaxID=6183 RepID=A0A5K4F6L0_SCHMA